MSTWGSEEFEDALTRAYIALYETPLKSRWHKTKGNMEFSAGLCDPEITREARKNFTVCHPDRIAYLAPEIDLINEVLPERFCMGTMHPRSLADWDVTPYFEICLARQIVPRMGVFVPAIPGTHYRCDTLHFGGSGVATTTGYLTVGRDGTVKAMRFTGKRSSFVVSEIMLHEADRDSLCSLFAYNLQLHNDHRRYLWSTRCYDSAGKIALPTYADEIKSLFYARSLPLTKAGRKAPLLHWVSAHRRRIKEGIEIDIAQYLRGKTDFVWECMNFRIESPRKKEATPLISSEITDHMSA